MGATPRATPLRMWGADKIDTPALEWADVSARLAASETYWVVNVPPGRGGVPAPRPVWGVWLDDRLLLSVGSSSVWSGLSADPACAVHLGDAIDVVIVEGAARRFTGPFESYVAAYNEKYSWSFAPDDEQFVVQGTVEVMPSRVLAWRGATPAESTPDMTFPSAAGRWVFD
jgi:hypothetical protein